MPGKKEVPDDGLRMTDDGVEMTDDDREMVDSGIGRNICRTDSHGENFAVKIIVIFDFPYLINQIHQVN